jgi:SP family general alpha glucoside:H+ symporter-like MFS transporter
LVEGKLYILYIGIDTNFVINADDRIRTLYLYGLCGLCTMLFILGFLGLVPVEHKQQASFATGSIMLVWALCYQLSVGTVCYSLVAELSTRRLQIKTVVLGRNL